MKRLLLLFAPLLFTMCSINAQHSVRGKSAPFSKTYISLRDSTGIYVADGDSDRLFYYALAPKATIKGALVLFPPNGQAAEETISANSALATLASDKGLLVVVPSINHNLCLDKPTLYALNTLLSDVLAKYRIPQSKVVLGGFSLGGMNAIRYTELAYEDSTLTVIRPAAVYGIDPPLDLTRLYYSFTRAVKKNFSNAAVSEANYFLERLNREFGGSPEAQPAIYIQHSMYSQESPAGGNSRYLRTIPVRIYSDPDIDWQLANRRVDYECAGRSGNDQPPSH
jgi:acetyl esterase/lipase